MKRATAIRRTPIRKRSSARKLKQQADMLVREKIFERDHRACVRCGATSVICSSHVYPKGRYPRMRWLEINLLTMCLGCHLFWWHKSPLEASEWFLKTYSERAAQLKLLANTAPKVDVKALLAEMTEGKASTPRKSKEK